MNVFGTSTGVAGYLQPVSCRAGDLAGGTLEPCRNTLRRDEANALMNRRLKRLVRSASPALIVTISLAALAQAQPPDAKDRRDPDIGRSFQVPYRLTDTNHFLVRVRINGKGPFNFLVDTGAPALYVSTESAKKVGLKQAEDAFWTRVERLDIEGGATLRGINARIEDPFQLVGMNALGLPGASIDGILGFTALARFRLELDPTRDRMTWTRLDFEPKDPFVPRAARGAQASSGGALNALGPVAKIAAALMGRQPEEERVPRGYLGLELEGGDGAGARVTRVLEGSPAAKAGLRKGDRLLRVGDHAVKSSKDAHAAVAAVRPGDEIVLAIGRDRDGGGQDERSLTLTAGEGF
jgi:hypothetical protein